LTIDNQKRESATLLPFLPLPFLAEVAAQKPDLIHTVYSSLMVLSIEKYILM